MNSANRVSVIGVGSPFGADRIGWLAVEALQRGALATSFPQLSLHFDQSDRPGSRLIGMLGECDCAVIVDAMQSGATPATLRCFLPEQLSVESGLVSSHGFGVVEALMLAAQLGVLPTRVVVIGIEVDTATEAETLLGSIMATLEVALQRSLADFADWVLSSTT